MSQNNVLKHTLLIDVIRQQLLTGTPVKQLIASNEPHKGDILMIQITSGEYANIGVIEYVEIIYGERLVGGYTGEEQEDGFMASGSQYFPVAKVDIAIQTFIDRLLSDPQIPITSTFGVYTLERIQEETSVTESVPMVRFPMNKENWDLVTNHPDVVHGFVINENQTYFDVDYTYHTDWLKAKKFLDGKVLYEIIPAVPS